MQKSKEKKEMNLKKIMSNAELRPTNLTNGGYWGDGRHLNLWRKRRV